MSLGELIFPRACAGCGAPGEVLCEHCREHLRHPPYLVARPRLLGAPVYALGSYSDIRRRIIIGMKERGNQPVREYVGAVFAAGLAYLSARGDIPREFTLVPAPTRPRSARARGGDPVAAVCHTAAQLQRVGVCAALSMGQSTADQSELNAQDRWANLQGRVRVHAPIARPCAACRRRRYHRRHPSREHCCPMWRAGSSGVASTASPDSTSARERS